MSAVDELHVGGQLLARGTCTIDGMESVPVITLAGAKWFVVAKELPTGDVRFVVHRGLDRIEVDGRIRQRSTSAAGELRSIMIEGENEALGMVILEVRVEL